MLIESFEKHGGPQDENRGSAEKSDGEPRSFSAGESLSPLTLEDLRS